MNLSKFPFSLSQGLCFETVGKILTAFEWLLEGSDSDTFLFKSSNHIFVFIFLSHIYIFMLSEGEKVR